MVQPGPVTRPRVRWGLWDFVIAWVVGVLFGALVGATFVEDLTSPAGLIVGVVGQAAGMIGYLVWVARYKGLGSLRADFGFVVRAGDLPWLFVGMGLQLVAAAFTLLPSELYGDTAEQEVVKMVRHGNGIELLLIVLCVALVAPVTEELLYRGLLLRGLLRRTDPSRAVFVSAFVFAFVHPIGDPSVGTLIALPAIFLLGLVSGAQAVRTGDLSRSIMLHTGFNALTVVFLLTSV